MTNLAARKALKRIVRGKLTSYEMLVVHRVEFTQAMALKQTPITEGIPGRMPGACVLHASAPVFPYHVQPPKGGHVTRNRSSPLDWNSSPSYLPMF